MPLDIASEQSAGGRIRLHTEAARQLEGALQDAQLLLHYAVENSKLPEGGEAGKTQADATIVDAILNAQEAVQSRSVTREIAVRFWLAFAVLSRATSPITAETLRACAKQGLRSFKIFVLLLATGVICGSIFLFMNNAISADNASLIEEQNKAALSLWSDLQFYRDQNIAARSGTAGELGRLQRPGSPALTDRRAFAGAAQPPAAVVARVTLDELYAEVVEFSRRNNRLLETAGRLNFWFNPWGFRIDEKPVVFNKENKYGVDHVLVPPQTSMVKDIVAEAINQIIAYQLIRNYSVAVNENNTVFYGGISTYLLPAVYALLGAALYGFRLYARLIRDKRYRPSAAYSARYYIALIAGIVIGLFNTVIPKNLMLPPLAVAFLVGYAVEAFFSRLDDMISRFRSSAAANQSAARAGSDAAPASAQSA